MNENVKKFLIGLQNVCHGIEDIMPPGYKVALIAIKPDEPDKILLVCPDEVQPRQLAEAITASENNKDLFQGNIGDLK